MNRTLLDNRKEGLIKLDPRSKLTYMLLTNLLIIFSVPVAVEISIILSVGVLFFLSNRIKQGLSLILIYGTIMIMNIYIGELVQVSKVAGIFIGGTIISRKLYPCIMLGTYLMTTTKISEFVLTMEKLRIPRVFIIPFAVMIRFFPTVYEEMGAIKDSMRIRGIDASFKNWILHPVLMIEYIFVPLLMSTIKIGEELSASCLTRGLTPRHKRSSYVESKYGVLDYLITAMTVVGISYTLIYNFI